MVKVKLQGTGFCLNKPTIPVTFHLGYLTTVNEGKFKDIILKFILLK